ncbi:MAG: hypothetical protein GPJ51_05065 [Candidatus Heimdallarchaeota archaeon]|nr:hypothetical protein [Candidatus Heimdallarchaeota archaeon]
MNKKIIFSILILTCLAFMPITASADYPTGTLGYSDDIAVGEEFEWTVDTLAFTGSFTSITSDAYIGTEYLTQGDKIKIVVTEDPDNATGDWFNFFVDGVQVDPYFGFLLLYGMAYSYAYFFISPVTYTNTTGTYSIYEQLIEELSGYSYDETYDYSTEVSSYTYEYGYTFQMEYSLEGDVFSFMVYEREYVSIIGGGYDFYMETEMRVQTSINVKTGLLGMVEVYMNIEVPAAYTYYMSTGSIHMIINSDYASTDGDGRTVPFAWGFSLLGVSTLAVLVVLVKRKRN